MSQPPINFRPSSQEQEGALRTYAAMQEITISDALREAVNMLVVENLEDIQAFQRAQAEASTILDRARPRGERLSVASTARAMAP